jgi:hypothetical protein
MTEIACIAWNAVVRRRSERRNSGGNSIADFRFRGKECDLVEDFGHIWNREHENEEDRILSHFESLLDQWAASGDVDRLGLALDRFAARSRTSMMWRVFMEAGAKYPIILGRELEPALTESLFFTHPDYSYGGISLFAALHKTADLKRRKRLEKLILDLPRTARFLHDQPREPIPDWLKYTQNKMLNTLDEGQIALLAVRTLRLQRAEREPLPKNRKPEGVRVSSFSFSDEEEFERRGLSLKDPTNAQVYHMRESLKAFHDRDGVKITVETIERNWPTIGQGERLLRLKRCKDHPMAEEVWGCLVAACEAIVRFTNWPSSDGRWRVVRRIFLKASTDPIPKTSEDENAKEDGWPCWGWPSPRIDAARGLIFLVLRIGRSDKEVKAAILKLSRDKSHPLRFNMGDRLAVLEHVAPELMWQLIDRFIRYERKFSVLEAVVLSLDHLIGRFPKEVKMRLARIDKRAIAAAPEEHNIHERLAHSHLFYFLRTGDSASESYIGALIADCDIPRASNALITQLHTCRAGGWLTAGDAMKIVEIEEKVRKRTWGFFGKLLTSAQAKLEQHRERWRQLQLAGQTRSEEMQPTEEAVKRMARMVDGIASQLYFASGALAEKQDKNDGHLTESQLRRYWTESSPLFRALAEEIHPHTTHQVVEALYHLLPCAPDEVFLTAASAITSSSTAGYQHESIAVSDVVKLIQRALADHREIFKSVDGRESKCLVALLRVLDLFVEAGWSQARQLTHRLEEIYR